MVDLRSERLGIVLIIPAATVAVTMVVFFDVYMASTLFDLRVGSLLRVSNVELGLMYQLHVFTSS